MQVRRLLLAVPVAALLIVSGCGRSGTNQGTVSGEVKLDGTPLEMGSIMFTPTEGTKGSVTGGQIEKGRYNLVGKAGVAVGWNRVEIRAVRKTGKMVARPMAPAGEMVEEAAEAVASRFNSASTLKVEVKAGDNTANFDVTSK